MLMAIALIVIAAGVLLFHYASPWWLTPLASNWGKMDDMLAITLVITAIFFVGINLFVAYMVLRFRHRPGPHTGHRAAYEPDNKKLERRLIVVSTLGITALLVPGLFVYADYVEAPPDALRLEALGQQWQWRFRFPGADGKLGPTDARFVNASNPFGLDPDHPDGANNVVVDGNEVHLPIGKPVKMLLRSHDVLHDFYVPNFRARMNIVPGMVTTFWFTPTVAGRYEIMCAQLCGVGHANMRGYVVVEDEASFAAWLKKQPTFAGSRAPAGTAGVTTGVVEQGRLLAQSKGCFACHSIDGTNTVGPTWKNLYGKTTTLTDGRTVVADEAYLRRAIRDPAAQLVKGFPPIMPKLELSDDELAALVAYIASLGPAPTIRAGGGDKPKGPAS